MPCGEHAYRDGLEHARRYLAGDGPVLCCPLLSFTDFCCLLLCFTALGLSVTVLSCLLCCGPPLPFDCVSLPSHRPLAAILPPLGADYAHELDPHAVDPQLQVCSRPAPIPLSSLVDWVVHTFCFSVFKK